MSIFEIFGKKPLSSVTAHILDPNAGYSKQTWTVGQHVPSEVVEKFSENGNIFVVVSYKAGTPNQTICRRDVWNQIKTQFDSIDEIGHASMRQIMSELDKLK